LTFPRALKCW